MRKDFIVSDKTSSLPTGLEDAPDKGPWYEGSAGERIEVRLSSTDTNGAYAIVESVPVPDCSVPLHLHRNEEEHFVVLAGTYRIQIEDKAFNAPAGTSVTVPRGARHSWRNISLETSRLLVILTPGGFEKCIQTIRDSPADKTLEIAAQYGCFLVGPPVSNLILSASAVPEEYRRSASWLYW
jgi:quercetin dioxygenase-like cupin family protein